MTAPYVMHCLCAIGFGRSKRYASTTWGRSAPPRPMAIVSSVRPWE